MRVVLHDGGVERMHVAEGTSFSVGLGNEGLAGCVRIFDDTREVCRHLPGVGWRAVSFVDIQPIGRTYHYCEIEEQA